MALYYDMNEPAFTPPFYVEVNKYKEVHIYDSDNALFSSFCTHTQLPLNDEEALAQEVEYWRQEAEKIAVALNASYQSNATKTKEESMLWDDLKVAFSIDDQDAFEAWGDEHGVWYEDNKILPAGWSVCETDSSGARHVAVFRVQGDFNKSDAQVVAKLITQFLEIKVTPSKKP